MKTLKQIVPGDDYDFLINCEKDDGFRIKLMLTDGLLKWMPDHKMSCHVNGTTNIFIYLEPISRHNHSKHLVDYANSSC